MVLPHPSSNAQLVLSQCRAYSIVGGRCQAHRHATWNTAGQICRCKLWGPLSVPAATPDPLQPRRIGADTFCVRADCLQTSRRDTAIERLFEGSVNNSIPHGFLQNDMHGNWVKMSWPESPVRSLILVGLNTVCLEAAAFVFSSS